jgi:hypothetical protein
MEVLCESENSSSKVNSDLFPGDESLKKAEEEKYKIERNLKEQANYNYDMSIKLIVLGDSYVGKSSVIKRICLEKFDFDIQPTISIDVQNYFIKINEKIIKFKFGIQPDKKHIGQLPNIIIKIQIFVCLYIQSMILKV